MMHFSKVFSWIKKNQSSSSGDRKQLTEAVFWGCFISNRLRPLMSYGYFPPVIQHMMSSDVGHFPRVCPCSGDTELVTKCTTSHKALGPRVPWMAQAWGLWSVYFLFEVLFIYLDRLVLSGWPHLDTFLLGSIIVPGGEWKPSPVNGSLRNYVLWKIFK